MPIYEYRCRKCRRVTETLQGISDPPPGKCSACGGRLERLISPGAFVLKGSGWYATDYARKGKGGEAGAGKGKDAGREGASCPAAGDAAAPACAGCPKAK